MIEYALWLEAPLGVTRAGRNNSPTSPGPGTLDYALRSIRAGKKRVMALAPMAVTYEPQLAPVVEQWRQMSTWQRRTTTLDDLLSEANVPPGAFLAAIVRAAYELDSTLTPLLVMAWSPGVIKPPHTATATALPPALPWQRRSDCLPLPPPSIGVAWQGRVQPAWRRLSAARSATIELCGSVYGFGLDVNP